MIVRYIRNATFTLLLCCMPCALLGASGGEGNPASQPAQIQWKASWISSPPTTQPTGGPMPIFRRSLVLGDKPISKAIIHICGLGQFELHINGQRIGDDVLQPGWTNY